MNLRIWKSTLSVLLAGCTTSPLLAQENREVQQSNQRIRRSENRSSNEDNQPSDDQPRTNQRRSSGDQDDYEARLRYNDDQNRLQIDVDDEIQFRDDSPRQSWTRGGEMDLGYDRDNNALTGQAEGTLRLNRVGRDATRWWQSWWDDETSGRRSRAQSADSGAVMFIRSHDANDDGVLTRRELPRSDRTEFDEIDVNQDNQLTRAEVRRHGESLYRGPRAGSSNDRTNSDSGDQSWAQWWSSWWSDSEDNDVDRIADQGAREFIRRHDENGDRVLVRSEMPSGMYAEFEQIDRNDDRRLTRQEVQRFAQESRDDMSARRSGSGQSSAAVTPAYITYIWLIEPQVDDLGRSELEQAYQLLSRLDANQDGKISPNEVDGQRQRAITDWVDERFDMLDRDENERLSRREAERSFVGTEFSAFDRDGSGALTRNEVRQTLRERLGSVARQSIDSTQR